MLKPALTPPIEGVAKNSLVLVSGGLKPDLVFFSLDQWEKQRHFPRRKKGL
jgi:hypothetical protein